MGCGVSSSKTSASVASGASASAASALPNASSASGPDSTALVVANNQAIDIETHAAAAPAAETASSGFSSAAEHKLRQLFKELDTSGTGEVSRRVLVLALRRNAQWAELLGVPQRILQEGPTRAAFEAAFHEIDDDGSGTLSIDEVLRHLGPAAEAAARAATGEEPTTTEVPLAIEAPPAVEAEASSEAVLALPEPQQEAEEKEKEKKAKLGELSWHRHEPTSPNPRSFDEILNDAPRFTEAEVRASQQSGMDDDHADEDAEVAAVTSYVAAEEQRQLIAITSNHTPMRSPRSRAVTLGAKPKAYDNATDEAGAIAKLRMAPPEEAYLRVEERISRQSADKAASMLARTPTPTPVHALVTEEEARVEAHYELMLETKGPLAPDTLAASLDVIYVLTHTRREAFEEDQSNVDTEQPSPLLERAERIAQRSLESHKEVFGNGSVQVAKVRALFSTLLLAKGSVQDAEEQARLAFLVRLELLGANHGQTLASMSALGVILRSFPVGQPLRYESLGLLQGAYEGRSYLYGKDGRETLESLFEYCVCLTDEDIFVNVIGSTLSRDVLHLPPPLVDADEAVLEDAIDKLQAMSTAAEATSSAMEELADVADPNILSPRSKVRWNVLRELGISPQEYFPDPSASYIATYESACVAALNGFRKVLEVRRHTIGSMHPDTIDAVAMVGISYAGAGLGGLQEAMLAKSLPYLYEAHSSFAKLFGKGGVKTLKVGRSLADVLLASDRPADASKLYAHLLSEARRGVALTTDSNVVDLERRYAEALADSGHGKEASRILMDQSSRLRASAGFASEAYAESCVAWAHSLVMTRDIVGAARAFRVGATAYAACLGSEHPETIDAKMRAANCEAML